MKRNVMKIKYLMIKANRQWLIIIYTDKIGNHFFFSMIDLNKTMIWRFERQDRYFFL